MLCYQEHSNNLKVFLSHTECDCCNFWVWSFVRLGSKCTIMANQITSVYKSPNGTNNSCDLFCVE